MIKNMAEMVVILVAITISGLTLSSRALIHHGYQLPFGWENPSINVLNSSLQKPGQLSICDRPDQPNGFPLVEIRPYQDICFNSNNELAFILNNIFYLVGYALLMTLLIFPLVLVSRRFNIHEVNK